MLLGQLANDPRAISDLRWYFTDAAGDMGLASNFEPMRAALERGGRSEGLHVVEANPRQFDAATRERHVRRALERLSEWDRQVLRAAFGRSERDLPAFGRATGVVPMTEAARLAHQHSGSPRPLEEWLARLVCNGARDAKAAQSLRVIRREADALVGAALAKFASAMSARLRVEAAKTRARHALRVGMDLRLDAV
jgi:hypothetical protein